MRRDATRNPLLVGFVPGAAFGLLDLGMTRAAPLEDDSPGRTGRR